MSRPGNSYDKVDERNSLEVQKIINPGLDVENTLEDGYSSGLSNHDQRNSSRKTEIYEDVYKKRKQKYISIYNLKIK
jgi:hypothetical protein